MSRTWPEPLAFALALGTALMCGVAIGRDLGLIEVDSDENRARAAHDEALRLMECDVSTEEQEQAAGREPWIVGQSRSLRESLAHLAGGVCFEADVAGLDCRVELQAVMMTIDPATRRVESREVKVELGALGAGTRPCREPIPRKRGGESRPAARWLDAVENAGGDQ